MGKKENMRGDDGKKNPSQTIATKAQLSSASNAGQYMTPTNTSKSNKYETKTHRYVRNEKSGKLFSTEKATGETREVQEHSPNSLIFGDKKAKLMEDELKAKQDSLYNVNAPKTAAKRKGLSMMGQ